MAKFRLIQRNLSAVHRHLRKIDKAFSHTACQDRRKYFCQRPLHRHLSNIDYLTASTDCLLRFISTVNGHSKKEEEAQPWKTSTSSGHITNLKQSILETFDIYGPLQTKWCRMYHFKNKTKNIPMHSHLPCLDIDTHGSNFLRDLYNLLSA